MTYAQLKALLLPQIFASGQAENLIGAHNAFFDEAMYDLQKHIECYRFSNHDLLPHCASYFNCGMTVIPQPQGKILEVYVIDRLDPDTGLESATGEDDWCAKVTLGRVNFCYLQYALKLCERCSSSPISEAANSIFTSLFGIYRRKTRYPKPTDEGMEALPALPPGFHYPQASTDASGRSPGGVYATQGGRIYIAPWIQSTETVGVRWTGIKRQWNDADLVEDDPKFRQAVRLHVAHQHESTYGEPSKATMFHMELWGDPSRGVVGVIPTLIHECHEQNRAVSCAEGSQNSGSSARGMGLQSNLFYNDQRFEFTATCPTGKTGASKTVVKEIGTVPSALSVQDANARAAQAAADEAQAQLVCADPVVTYHNTQQTYTASCPGQSENAPAATGTPITVTIPANNSLYDSTVSQAASDALALAAATAQAQSQLVCTFHNAAQTRSATCPTGTTGTATEATVPAGQPEHDSTVSQADADAKAAAAAQNAAQAALVCAGASTFLVGNQATPAHASGICRRLTDGRQFAVVANFTVPAFTFSSMTTATTEAFIRSQLNAQAQAYGQAMAQSMIAAQCQQLGGTLT